MKSSIEPAHRHGRAGTQRQHVGGWPAALAAALLAAACSGEHDPPATGVSRQRLLGDTGTLNIEVPDRTGYAIATTSGGATAEYLGDQNVTFGSSGSGIFASFVRLQADGVEAGYNTDGALEFDTKAGNFTHSILVSDIPVIAVDGKLYWELFADINDSDKTPLISVNDIEVFLAADPALTGYDFGADATKVYDFHGTIQIHDVNQGSGRGDLRFRIPVADIAIPGGCGYKDPACQTYFVLFSRFGATGGAYASDGGFEEWKVKQYPYVTVTKTAQTTFTRTFDWTIDKSVIPATWDLFTGESGTSTYTVTVSKAGSTDSDWGVAGDVTIENPGDLDATITAVTDALAPGVDCGVTFPHLLASGDSLSCSYGAALPDGADRTNTAVVTLADGPVFTGTASVTFGSPTTLVRDTIHVSDTYAGGLGAFSASGSVKYDRKLGCDGDAGTHGNTATIDETGASDSASVTVSCHEITVSKDAATSFERTYAWSIDKSADRSAVELMPGQTFLVNYAVVVATAGHTDSRWAAAGKITISNPAPIAATINGVADVMSGPVTAGVDCGVAFPYSLAAGGSLVCTYGADLPDASDRINTATATRQSYDHDAGGSATPSGTADVSGSAAVTFSSTPSTETDECVTVDDSYAGVLGTVCSGEAPRTFSYSRVVGGIPAEDCGDHTVDNTARFTTTDTGATGSDSWSVILHVLCPPPGCSLTQGYWKTHSERGPAPYDDAWALLPAGASTPFYQSGGSWYQVFWTPPKGGNAYYLLAHQYMAAVLNQLNGAGSTAGVDAALAWAVTFFSTHTPSEKLAAALREQAISYASLLAAYNQGDVGPGHCSEDALSSLAP